VSKRSYRRLAVVAGTALAIGSMAPAMAQRIDVDGGAGASVQVDPAAVSSDAATDAISLLGILGPMPTPAQALGLATTQEGIALLTLKGQEDYARGVVNDVLGKVIVLGAGLGDDCGLVNVLSCNNGGVHFQNIDVNVLSGGPGNGNGPGVFGGPGLVPVLAPVHGIVQSTVAKVLNLDPTVGLLASVGASL